MAVLSPVGDLKIVFPISTFVLNTLTSSNKVYFPLFIRGRHASFYAFVYFTLLFQVLEELARAMNGEISKTLSGRSEISKDQVR